MNRRSRLDYEPLSDTSQGNLIDFLHYGPPHAVAGSGRRDWSPRRMGARREFCAKCRIKRNPNRCFTSRAHAQQRAIRLLSAGSGFSVNATGQSPASGYMVSIYGAEQTIPLQPNLSPFVATYFQSHSLAPAEYWGGWIDDGKLVLDVSLNVCSREDATLLGHIFQQRAIYDIAARQVIELTPASIDNSAQAGSRNVFREIEAIRRIHGRIPHQVGQLGRSVLITGGGED